MIIVSNWKAYVETTELAKQLVQSARKLTKRGHTLILCVPAPYMDMVLDARYPVALGAQDISVTLGGAETGEITAGVVASVGARYVIVGHSERRAMGESDHVVLEKVRHALAHGLVPIVCIGERERDEDAQYLKFVRAQIAAIYGPLSQKERMQIVFAYEPIWAIGKTAAEAITTTDLTEMIAYIRKVLGEYLPGSSPSKVAVLYGGSAEAANARMLAAGTGIDGFLVGHASTNVAQYTALIEAL